MKNNNHRNFSIVCTSTLELGIDIGTVDEVVQIDATHSIASLIQRVGRSGRQDGQSSNLLLYATDGWNLLQSLACWKLHKEGFIEPPQVIAKPFDILLHQALSITRGHSGIQYHNLIKKLKDNFAFRNIEIAEIEEIINHLISIDLLEKLRNELILGIEGEKIVNSRDFYSLFTTETAFKVSHAGNKIGEIPYSPQIAKEENIFLAAHIWKIVDIDFKSNKIEVVPAHDGKKPMFPGGTVTVHPKIRQNMLDVLFNQEMYLELNSLCTFEIEQLRKEFSVFRIQDTTTERPLLIGENGIELFTFTGTKINRSLGFLLKLAELKFIHDPASSSFSATVNYDEFINAWNSLTKFLPHIDCHLEGLLKENPAILQFSKWGTFLPKKFQISILKEVYYDFSETEKSINTFRTVDNKI